MIDLGEGLSLDKVESEGKTMYMFVSPTDYLVLSEGQMEKLVTFIVKKASEVGVELKEVKLWQ